MPGGGPNPEQAERMKAEQEDRRNYFLQQLLTSEARERSVFFIFIPCVKKHSF